LPHFIEVFEKNSYEYSELILFEFNKTIIFLKPQIKLYTAFNTVYS